jgi:hypothetical protein
VGGNGSNAEQEVEVVVDHRQSIALDSGIFQEGAQAVYKVLLFRIVQEYPLAVDPPCDHMVEGAGCVPYSLTAAFDTTANDMVQCPRLIG